jgi:hypothetical protein
MEARPSGEPRLPCCGATLGPHAAGSQRTTTVTSGLSADQAGISWEDGGIHFNDGDFEARQAGELVGLLVWSKAKTYFNGKAIPKT